MSEELKKVEFELGTTKLGRPRIWPTPEDLLKECEAYFEKAKEEKDPIHIEGLCAHLNVARNTLLNYSKAEGFEEYFKVVEWAKGQILSDLVTRSMTGKHNPAGTIFNLKNNYGYTDKTEINHKLEDKGVKEIKYVLPEGYKGKKTESQ